MTRKTSTPTNPPGRRFGQRWYITTKQTANARIHWMSARCSDRCLVSEGTAFDAVGVEFCSDTSSHYTSVSSACDSLNGGQQRTSGDASLKCFATIRRMRTQKETIDQERW